MRVSRTVCAAVALAAALSAGVVGCGNKQASSPSTQSSSGSATTTSTPAPAASPPAPPADYSGLLIQAKDIDAPVQFTGRPATNSPNGQPGVATTFTTEDSSHVIKDTIQVLADPAAATSALDAAKGAQGDAVKNPRTEPFNVGTGGTTLSGNSPDNSKGVLVLIFTEGRAFVTLEFDGPVDTLPPQDFVNDVAQKQDAAIKKGLGG